MIRKVVATILQMMLLQASHGTHWRWGSTKVSLLPCEMAQAANRAAELFTAGVDTYLLVVLIVELRALALPSLVANLFFSAQRSQKLYNDMCVKQ